MSLEPPINSDSVQQIPESAQTAQPRRRVRQRHQVRSLILDYALGLAIVGLLPIPRLLTLKLIVALGLVLKMIWDIGKLWRFRKGQDLLAIVGVLFGSLGAAAMSFTAWLTLFGLGVVVPALKGLAFAAALFTLAWALGQAISQFYASSDYQEEEQP